MLSRVFLFSALVVAVVASMAGNVSAADDSIPWRPVESDFLSFMGKGNGTAITGDESLPELRAKVIKRLGAFCEELLFGAGGLDTITRWWARDTLALFRQHADAEPEEFVAAARAAAEAQRTRGGARLSEEDFKPLGTEQYPYFAMLPPLMGSVVPGASAPVTWANKCFKKNSATAAMSADGKYLDIALTVSEPASLTCSDQYLFATVDGAHVRSVFTRGTHTIKWKLNEKAAAAERWDVETRGVRVCTFLHDPIQTVVDLYDTVMLFLEPLTHKHPSQAAALHNIDFLTKYSERQPFMTKRAQDEVDIDESLIKSGDFIGVVRLDGLDPMLAWAMGSTTGHTTIALRINGTLFVTESTSKDSYWPVNGIQKTPFKEWIQRADAAGFQVVWAPLRQELSDHFDEQRALAFFESVQGYNYGYQNMLASWIDTLNDNYPCLPPHFQAGGECLAWEHLEVAFSWVEKLAPSLSIIFAPMWNKRLGVEGKPLPELLQLAHAKGLQRGELPTIVEQDSWTYKVSRYGKPDVGPAMVCCVFVCKMMKAGGVFTRNGVADEDVNCTEFTNADVYSMDVFSQRDEAAGRPKACVAADPNNQLCQLLGDYTLNLNDYNSRPVYKHMCERCPTEAPKYTHPPGC